MSDHSGGGVETVKEDIGTSSEDVVRRWKTEIKLAQDVVNKWHTRGDEVVERYRDEKEHKDSRFNILWSNTEIMKPAVYGSTPIPEVRRRITDPKNPDPVGREAAIVLERGLSYSIDDYDFDGVMQDLIEDFLLPGRGIARVKYIPTMALGEPPRIPIDSAELTFEPLSGASTRRFFVGEREIPEADVLNGGEILAGEGRVNFDHIPEQARPYMLGERPEEVVNEEVRAQYVYWKDYLESPASSWNKVRWVAYLSRPSRSELRKQFGHKIGDAVELDWSPKGLDETDDSIAQFFKRATVWEIWDKETRRVIVIATGYNDGPLATWDDPLELEDFFPGPEPLDFVSTTGSRVPIPVYTQYQDLAVELDEVTQRIRKLVAALKVRGVFDKVEAALEQILTKPDATLVGIDNFAELSEKGGLDRVISFLPIEQIAKVLNGLYVQRDQIKTAIHEVTGLSDIIRGSTDPKETKGAQVLKAEFGTLRLQGPQVQVQRYARDLLRLTAEIMAEHFLPETLEAMSGVGLPSAEDQAQAQQMVQQAQQQQQAPDPQAIELLKKPTWDQVMELLRDDGARGFRIDIETDSTIQPNAEQAKAQSNEMIAAVTGFLKESVGVVQVAPQMLPFMMEMLKLGLRQFKPGRMLEETLNEATARLEEAAQQPQGDPEGEARMAEQEAQQAAQADAAKVQVEGLKLQLGQQKDQAKMEIEKAKLRLEQQEMLAKQQIEQSKIALDRQEAQADVQVAEAKAQNDILKTQLERQKLNLQIKELEFRRQEMFVKAESEQQKIATMGQQKIAEQPHEHTEKPSVPMILNISVDANTGKIKKRIDIIRDKSGQMTAADVSPTIQ